MVFITFHYRYRKQIIIGIMLLVLLIGIIVGGVIILKPKEKKKSNLAILTNEKNKIKKKKKVIDEDSEEYKVDIKGEINVPGIYSLKASSRVIDVIEKAGGLTENADTSVINLSLKIQDEMVIIIYSKEQVREFEATKEKEKLLQDKCNKPDDNSLSNDACIQNNSNNSKNKNTLENGKISINSASVEELMNLPGIGEAKAKDIVNYRDTNGPFQSIEDIMKVSGIGESTFAQIKENITV